MDKTLLDNIDLSEAEQDLLKHIEKKIQDYIAKEQEKNLANIDEVMKSPAMTDSAIYNKHITNYDREIFVHLEMEISAVNEDNQLKEVGQILENFYHIPIPSGVDYIEKMQNFVNIFDKELNDCAIKIHSNNEK